MVGFVLLRQMDALASILEVLPVRGLTILSCVCTVFVPDSHMVRLENQSFKTDSGPSSKMLKVDDVF